jgi:hypothetical protein
MLKTINVPQFSLVIKEINYNMQKVLIGSSVIYENQHVSKVLHSPTTILLWQIFTILQCFIQKKIYLLPTTNCQKDQEIRHVSTHCSSNQPMYMNNLYFHS